MKHKGKIVIGLGMVLLGLLLLANSLDILNVSFGDVLRSLIPLFFIGLGIWMIVRRKRMEDQIRMNMHFEASSHPDSSNTAYTSEERKEPNRPADNIAAEQASAMDSGKMGAQAQQFYASSNYQQSYQTGPQRQGADGKLRYSKSLGELTVDLSNMSLRDVEVSMGVGDLEVRLSGGILSDGLNRIIISGFVGDIRVMVPQNFPLFAHCSNFVGDIELMGRRTSGFGNNLESQSANYGSATQKLYIACNNFIGDIRVVWV